MIVRQHRGGLTESMETAETIEPTLDAVSAWAELVLRMKCPAHKIRVGVGVYDVRTHSSWHLLSLPGVGVLGMCNEVPR